MSSGMNSTQPFDRLALDRLDRPPSRLASFAGTLIALITLVLPLWTIIYYSEDARNPQGPAYVRIQTE